jgi:anti-sigma-K factor RskA
VTSTDDIGEKDGDAPLAGEFVLGLLPDAERRAFAARLAAEPGLRAEVRVWQVRLSSLDGEFTETAPPAGLRDRIEARLFPQSQSSGPVGLWQSLRLWRGLAAGSLAIAVLAIGFGVTRPVPVDPEIFATQLVAALHSQEGSGVEFVALYDAANGTVRLASLSGEPVPQRDYELWLIAGSDAPVSMGVIPVANSAVPVSSTLRPRLGAGATFAVSLEPQGGSPTGSPTGPIVALGPAVAI